MEVDKEIFQIAEAGKLINYNTSGLFAISFGIRYSEDEEIKNFREFFKGDYEQVTREFFGMCGMDYKTTSDSNFIVWSAENKYNIPVYGNTTTHLDGSETHRTGLYMRISRVPE